MSKSNVTYPQTSRPTFAKGVLVKFSSPNTDMCYIGLITSMRSDVGFNCVVIWTNNSQFVEIGDYRTGCDEAYFEVLPTTTLVALVQD